MQINQKGTTSSWQLFRHTVPIDGEKFGDIYKVYFFKIVNMVDLPSLKVVTVLFF